MYLVEGMRILRFVTFAFALVLIAASAAGSLFAQDAPPAQAPAAASPISIPTQAEAAPTIRYNNRYELYGGFAYAHFKAGPNLLQGANLGGFDIQGTRWLTPRWGAMANVRGYYGTSGVVPNTLGIEGPFVSQHFFLAGPELRGPRNQHAAITLHALVGGVYGHFTSALDGNPPAQFGFFDNGFGLGAAFGGTIVLNESPRWAFQISPDDVLSRFDGSTQNNFAISVGVLYRFTKKQR
jgi:hypothetical protein